MNLVRYVWVPVILVVAIAAFFGGRALHPAGEAAYTYDSDAPAYDAAPPIAALSRGGFSGFGETPGLDGATLIAGRLTAVSNDSLTVESATGVRTTLRLGASPRLQRLEAADRSALRPGVSVVLRQDTESDAAVAVLIVTAP